MLNNILLGLGILLITADFGTTTYAMWRFRKRVREGGVIPKLIFGDMADIGELLVFVLLKLCLLVAAVEIDMWLPWVVLNLVFAYAVIHNLIQIRKAIKLNLDEYYDNQIRRCVP